MTKQRRGTRNKGHLTTLTEFSSYCEQHPRSPAAIRLPKITRRGGYWVALLGATLETGIAGIGRTVGAALGAFDRQYLNLLQPGARAAARDSSATASSRERTRR